MKPKLTQSQIFVRLFFPALAFEYGLFSLIFWDLNIVNWGILARVLLALGIILIFCICAYFATEISQKLEMENKNDN